MNSLVNVSSPQERSHVQIIPDKVINTAENSIKTNKSILFLQPFYNLMLVQKLPPNSPLANDELYNNNLWYPPERAFQDNRTSYRFT